MVLDTLEPRRSFASRTMFIPLGAASRLEAEMAWVGGGGWHGEKAPLIEEMGALLMGEK
jgi:hypothetical protein